jgi:hypothetical protein
MLDACSLATYRARRWRISSCIALVHGATEPRAQALAQSQVFIGEDSDLNLLLLLNKKIHRRRDLISLSKITLIDANA